MIMPLRFISTSFHPFKLIVLITFLFHFASCISLKEDNNVDESVPATKQEVAYIKVLGTIQDAGFPHIGCKKACCWDGYSQREEDRRVVSLGLVDSLEEKMFLFEATPDISTQIKELQLDAEENRMPDGIFLSHAHIGHYSGLMYLGKEAIDADSVTVFAMPRMYDFLSKNGPWDQLVKRKNIQLSLIKEDSSIKLSSNLSVQPILVPHRDEYSETVGFLIEGPSKKALFIPDIDKWSKWERNIVDLIESVDYAFLDATFFSGEEVGYRDISEIPHPFVIESMELFDSWSREDRSKIIFIHFNHTNPLIDKYSEEYDLLVKAGYQVAKRSSEYSL